MGTGVKTGAATRTQDRKCGDRHRGRSRRQTDRTGPAQGPECQETRASGAGGGGRERHECSESRAGAAGSA